MTPPEDADPAPRARRTALAAALIVACGLAAYSNSFTDLFLGLDGKQSIRDNPHIHRLWPLTEALSVPMWPNPDDLEELLAAAPVSELTLTEALADGSLGGNRRAPPDR